MNDDDVVHDGEDERITAWDQIARHPFFRECYDSEDTLIAAMLAKLDEVHKYLTAPTNDERIGN